MKHDITRLRNRTIDAAVGNWKMHTLGWAAPCACSAFVHIESNPHWPKAAGRAAPSGLRPPSARDSTGEARSSELGHSQVRFLNYECFRVNGHIFGFSSEVWGWGGVLNNSWREFGCFVSVNKIFNTVLRKLNENTSKHDYLKNSLKIYL